MQYKKLIYSEIEFAKSFKMLAAAYEEISVMKMRKIRQSVLSTRVYLEKLSEVFAEIGQAYQRLKTSEQKKSPAEKKDRLSKKDKSQTEKINKRVSVFLSANTSLYGDLIERVSEVFKKETAKIDTDLVIIGRLGKRLYDQSENKKAYLYFELPDTEITLEYIKPVIYHLVKYQTVVVYYSKFESLGAQMPAIANVSGDQPMTIKTKIKEEIPIEYLFEPSLKRIMSIFQDLISTSLFRQTINESQLARQASRIMLMEKAQQNVDDQLKKLGFLEKNITNLESQKKQLDRITSMGMWRR